MRFSVPVTPDPDTARQWAQDELSKSIYHHGESLADRIGRWLSELFNKLLDAGNGSSIPPLGYLLGAIVLVALIVVATRIAIPAARQRRRGGKAVLLEDDARTAQQIRDAAQASARDGDHTAAALDYFRALVRGCEERVIIDDRAGRTAREAARDIASSINRALCRAPWGGDHLRRALLRPPRGHCGRLLAHEGSRLRAAGRPRGAAGGLMTLQTLPPGFVLGDGSTAGATARSGWRRFGWAITLVVVALLVLVFLVFTKAPSSTTPLSINNAQPSGARALAEILRQQGVDVTESATLSGASKKLGADGTLVIGGYSYLDKSQVTSILNWPGPVLWLAPSEYDLSTIVPKPRGLARRAIGGRVRRTARYPRPKGRTRSMPLAIAYATDVGAHRR